MILFQRWSEADIDQPYYTSEFLICRLIIVIILLVIALGLYLLGKKVRNGTNELWYIPALVSLFFSAPLLRVGIRFIQNYAGIFIGLIILAYYLMDRYSKREKVEEGKKELQKLIWACERVDPNFLADIFDRIFLRNKGDFLGRMHRILEQAKRRGIKSMRQVEGTCSVCFKGQKVYYFVTNDDPFYSVTFIVLKKKDVIEEIKLCFRPHLKDFPYDESEDPDDALESPC